MAIHTNPIRAHSIASQPVNLAPAKNTKTQAFSTLLNNIASNKPAQRTSIVSATANSSTSTPTTTSTSSTPISPFPISTDTTPVPTPVSSTGTSLANLMAAASYAGVPYADLSATYNAVSNGSYDPNWQTKLANALEARLESVAGSSTANQVYDPNPANDSVPIDLTNTKQFSSASSDITGLLSNMWSAVHAGDVNGYHAALQQVDSWYQSNGQQNYYTGLSDGQIAAFNPANRLNPGVEMPNANPAIAAAELAAITGQSTSMSNLASVAQTAAIKT